MGRDVQLPGLPEAGASHWQASPARMGIRRERIPVGSSRPHHTQPDLTGCANPAAVPHRSQSARRPGPQRGGSFILPGGTPVAAQLHVAGTRPHGAELVGEVTRYEDSYLLCYLRGPGGIILALAEQLS
jgi:hypothetical protein